jgi:DNA-binding SARP family transcriptional activator/class 3 adenylate cyclase
MEFQILGPLEVLDGGQALNVGGGKQRGLLAVLLLNASRVVSSDALIDALWGEQPPETAAKAIQIYVSQLRRVLGKERLETKAPGYLLRVGRDELDLYRFEALLEEGKESGLEAASETLREALALWRGPPLAEFGYASFAQPEIARLEELHLACLEARIEADLLCGRHAELVSELDGLVAEHPLRERLRAQLMLALYRSGRQAEALVAYRDAWSALVEELGVEPGRSLRELHQAILRQDPALDLVQATVPQKEPEPAPIPVPPPEPQPVVREGRKTVTVLAAGLIALAEGGERLDPEALRRATSRAFMAVEFAVERHGGMVEAITGGTVTAIFGIPAVHEDDAVRALRAAAEMRDRLPELVDEPELHGGMRVELRIGVSTGEVVTGGGEQLPPTGEPLAAAHRLGQEAGAGEIVLDDATHRLARDAVAVEPAEVGFRLIGVTPQPSGHVSRFESPMVGRERERRRLHGAFETAVGDRSCQLFTVLGLAGVGKSRLVQEFLGDLETEALVLRGRCLSYGEGITYWPLREAVQEAAGLEDTDSPELGMERLVGLLEDENDSEALARGVGELIGLTEVGLGAEASFTAVRVLFESLAHRAPLVIVFDDIHWGEATFLDLVEHAADWIREAPVLLVCIARPELLELRPSWGGGKLNATTVLLEPLSDQESAQLVDNLAGAELQESITERIVEAAEGNPLFLVEMLALAMEDGREAGRLEVPPTIQALLAARLDRLGDDERAVIERAAVQGKVFYEDAVTELAPEELRPAVASALGSLLLKELIRPERPSLGGHAYRFRHLLIRDAAYEAISKEARADMHERFGRWLERAAGGRATEYEEVLGYHLERACRYLIELGPVDDPAAALGREAAERLGAAGRRAFIRSDAPAGVNLISRAVALLSPDDPLRVELVPNVRVVQGMGGDMRWADRVLTEAVEAAATSGDRRLAAHALVQRGLLRLFTEAEVTPEELLDAAERSLPVFEELNDELGMARAWRLKAQAHYLARRGGPCADASERALEHARRAGDRFEEREIVEWLVIALLLGPAPAAEAAPRCEQLIAETADHPLLQAEVLAALAVLSAMQRRTAEADELIARGRTLMNDVGSWMWIVSFWWSFVYSWRGDPTAAEHELRPSYEALKKLGEKSHLSSICHALSHALYEQGRYDEAEQLTRECEEASRPNDVHSQILWRSTRAKVIARSGEFDAAERLAREAVEFAAESDFHLAHADALMDLAEVLDLRGESDAAAVAIQEATRFYELKGNLAATERARALLPELHR